MHAYVWVKCEILELPPATAILAKLFAVSFWVDRSQFQLFTWHIKSVQNRMTNLVIDAQQQSFRSATSKSKGNDGNCTHGIVFWQFQEHNYELSGWFTVLSTEYLQEKKNKCNSVLIHRTYDKIWKCCRCFIAAKDRARMLLVWTRLLLLLSCAHLLETGKNGAVDWRHSFISC